MNLYSITLNNVILVVRPNYVNTKKRSSVTSHQLWSVHICEVADHCHHEDGNHNSKVREEVPKEEK